MRSHRDCCLYFPSPRRKCRPLQPLLVLLPDASFGTQKTRMNCGLGFFPLVNLAAAAAAVVSLCVWEGEGTVGGNMSASCAEI